MQARIEDPVGRTRPFRRAEARSLALALREEFGTPFAVYDAATGEPLDGTDDAALSPAEARILASFPQAQVPRLVAGEYEIALPFTGPSAPGLLAVGSLRALGRGEADECHERARLGKWAQAVCDRLRRPPARPRDEPGPGGLGWEAVATLDRVLRRLRVNKDRGENQLRILRAAAELLRMEAVVWVPCSPEREVVVGGELGLSPHEFRHIATLLARNPDLERRGWLSVNAVEGSGWGASFPQLENLVALPVREPRANGLLIAFNKKEGGDHGLAGEAVRRGDALALTPFAALFGMHAAASLRYQELKEFLVGLTRSLTAAIDAKDSYTYGHSERVGRIAVELGRALGLPEDELSDVYLAGLLHDIGKIGVRDAVLSKRDALTSEEMEHLQQHVTIGHAILSDLHQIRHLLPGVLYHHERYDGKGYPEGLKGESIPLLARILAVADSYDAMSTTRPYRQALPPARVDEILGQGAGTQWDAQVIDAYFRCRERVGAVRHRGVGVALRQAIDGALRQAIDGALRQDSSQGTARRPF